MKVERGENQVGFCGSDASNNYYSFVVGFVIGVVRRSGGGHPLVLQSRPKCSFTVTLAWSTCWAWPEGSTLIDESGVHGHLAHRMSRVAYTSSTQLL